MEKISVISGPVEIIASATVASFEGNPIIIECPLDGKEAQSMSLIFKFVDNEEKDNDIQGKPIDTSTLELTLYNFKNPLGEGLDKPAPIGMLNDRKLYLLFKVASLTEKDKVLSFTIFQERDKEAAKK